MHLLQKTHKYLTLGLLVFIGIEWLYLQRLERQRDEFLSENLKLDDSLNRIINVTNNLLFEKYRKNGQIKTKKTFIPPEGKTVFKVDKDNNVTIKVYNKGFTIRPGISISYQKNETVVGFSSKLFYWGRMGLIVDTSKNGFGVGVSRYIDDLVPYWHPKNVELFISKPLFLFQDKSSNRIYIGLRISL